jgi:Tfp pilus assembly protein PilF
LPFYTNARPDEVFPKAKENVAKALEIDASLPEAHGTRAYILTYYDWDWKAAEPEFQRALALNPNDAKVRERYSRFLSSLGRIPEALAELERARLLDPNELGIKANLGVVYYFARQYDQAIEALQKILHDHPDFDTAHWGLGLAYSGKGDYEHALPELERVAKGGGPNSLASLGYVYGRMGRSKEARDVLAEMQKRAKETAVSGYQFAVVHIGLGETESALQSLEQAYRDHSTTLGYIKMDPRLDSLHGNPRFQALLRQMNFPN